MTRQDVRTVIVRFSGDGAGTEDLSWGQQEIWGVMRAKGSRLPLDGVRALPPGQSVADLAAPGFVISRHQSLRSTLLLDPDGRTRQVAHAAGAMPLDESALIDAARGAGTRTAP